MKAKTFLVYGMALLLGAGGCSAGEMSERDTTSPLKVFNFTNSGCLSNLKSGTAEAPTTTERHEVLRLRALENGRLQICHDSAVYQCAADIKPEITREGNLIRIKEHDMAAAEADCLCPCNLKYEIPLAYGDYKIRINDRSTFPFTHAAGLDMTIIIGDYQGY